VPLLDSAAARPTQELSYASYTAGNRGTVLHAFQCVAVEQIERELGQRCKLLLVAPTGSGKTVIASEIFKRAVAKHRTALFLAHRREIILQTSAKLTANGVRHGIIMAGVDPRPMEAVQVASIDTLLARGVRSDAMPLPPADFLIFDEAHRARGRTREHLISLYPDAALLGMTATPCRGDGRGLGNIFEQMIECPQVAELIAGGFLVGTKVFAPVEPNLKGVKTVTGDYAVGQLEDRMNTDALVGDVVSDWLQHGERRRTVAFAVGVEHSVHICNEFVKSGVRAEHLDGETPVTEREAILARLASGETEVVTNCMVLTEGFDCPDIGCIVLARPTRQMGLYRQMIGRGLRTAPDKRDCIILDHSGAVYRHGLPEDRVEWSLNVDHRAVAPAHERRKRGEDSKLSECPQCKVLMVTPPPCIHCGWAPAPRRGRDVDFAAGELGLVVGGKATAKIPTQQEQIVFHAELRGHAVASGYKPGWAAHKFKDKFGHFPPWSWNDRPTCAPTVTTIRWIKSRNIAFAKRRVAA
jgi:superfamily II DNA or RNA helicase